MTVDFTKYFVTTARLEPAATLAFAATQSQDPTMSLVAASFAELVRQINMDVARPRTTRERVEEASKVTSDFAKVYGTNKPVTPPAPQVDPQPAPCRPRRGASAADLSGCLQPPLS